MRSIFSFKNLLSNSCDRAYPESCSRGFTLIEILVAIMILAISLTIILQLFSSSLKAGMLSDEYARAVFHANAKMDELLIQDEFQCEVINGDFGDGYLWQYEIVCQKEEDGEAMFNLPVQLITIKVDVSWHAIGHEKHFEISTLKVGKLITNEPDDNV